MKRKLLYSSLTVLVVSAISFGIGLSIPNNDSYLRGVRDGRLQAYTHFISIAAQDNIYKSLVLITPNNNIRDCIFIGKDSLVYTEDSTNNTILNSWLISKD